MLFSFSEFFSSSEECSVVYSEIAGVFPSLLISGEVLNSSWFLISVSITEVDNLSVVTEFSFSSVETSDISFNTGANARCFSSPFAPSTICVCVRSSAFTVGEFVTVPR